MSENKRAARSCCQEVWSGAWSGGQEGSRAIRSSKPQLDDRAVLCCGDVEGLRCENSAVRTCEAAGILRKSCRQTCGGTSHICSADTDDFGACEAQRKIYGVSPAAEAGQRTTVSRALAAVCPEDTEWW